MNKIKQLTGIYYRIY